MTRHVITPVAFACVVLAGGLAGFQTQASPAPAPQEHASRSTTNGPGGSLPMNHPPVASGRHHPSTPTPIPTSEAATLGWAPPPEWHSAPNPSALRLATFRVPAQERDGEAELSVSRAGGTTGANVDRWLGQFDGAPVVTREERSVQGLHVTVVSITGYFLGGGMTPGAPAPAHPSWGLLAAIVETPGSPYFFKLTGPEATVKAARREFDTMIDGITRL